MAKNRAAIDVLETEIAKQAYARSDALDALTKLEAMSDRLINAEDQGMAPRSFLSQERDERASAEERHQALGRAYHEAAERVRASRAVLERQRAHHERMQTMGIHGAAELNGRTLGQVADDIAATCRTLRAARRALVDARKSADAGGYTFGESTLEEPWEEDGKPAR